jgi:Ca-activated chloride channel family protein
MISNNSFRSSAAKTRLLLFSLIITALLACASAAYPQEKDPIDVVKVNTDLVVFDVQVIDKQTGRVVGDLNKEDFELSDKGVKQQLSYFSRDELPLSIILLLDVSRSTRPIIHDIRDGALNALQRLKPDDQVAVMAFSERSQLAQDFTKDRALVCRKIEEVTATNELGNGTFLGAAMKEAAFHMQTAPTPTSRRVIIAITDNIAPTKSREQKAVLRDLFESGTVVYGLIVRATIGKVFNLLSFGQIKAVNKYVEATGGEVLGADKKEVDAKLSEVIDRLRARYAIGFRPSNVTDDGKFRPVAIKISPATKRKEKPIVLTKRGYYLRRRKD